MRRQPDDPLFHGRDWTDTWGGMAGIGLTLLAGILHLLTVEPNITGWGDPKNQTIAVPFKGDMPALIFSYLARENGLRTDQDITLQYTASPVEAMRLLLSGLAALRAGVCACRRSAGGVGVFLRQAQRTVA